MKVQEIMTRNPARCTPSTSLAAAAEILWDSDCGMLPVVDADEKLIGVATDRDICIALGTRNRLPSDMPIKEVASTHAICCKPDEDLRTTLAKLAEAKVRRLPVVDSDGKLVGIVGLGDLVALEHFTPRRAGGLSAEEIVNVLASIYAEPRTSRHTAAKG